MAFRFYQLFLLFLGFVLSSCSNDIKTVNAITNKKILPLETGKNVELTYSDSARLKVKVKGPVVTRLRGENPYTEFPKGVHVRFYDGRGEIQSELTSNYAIKQDKERKMEAKNNVVVINKKGETLNTEHLIWDEEQRLIYSDEHVKITTENQIIYGSGFKSNEDFTKYEIKEMKGSVKLDEAIDEED